VAGFIDACFPGPSTRGSAVERPSALAKNQIAQFGFSGTEVWLGRTGYTGEDGFEIVAPASAIAALWEHVLTTGRPQGVKPAGLGARDTLRTEMCYPLYGHELDENTTPIEAGLGRFVALSKGEFVGRTVLAQQKENGVGKKLVPFKMAQRTAPPRPHYAIWSAGPNAARVGIVTSGTQSPSLAIGVGMGFVKPEFAAPGTALGIEIRGKCATAVIVPKPIYRKAD
jgi:aminomethyltransferase